MSTPQSNHRHDDSAEIVFTVDQGGDSDEEQAIIADITCDDAWTVMSAADAPVLFDWE